MLLAGLHAAGETSVIETEATRDHTERMLRHFGAEVSITESGGKSRITVKGEAELLGRDVTVPGDPSSAAFLAAAARIVPGSDITHRGRARQSDPHRILPSRSGKWAPRSTFTGMREEGGEPVADIRVRYAPLAACKCLHKRAPSMIDEYPVLAVVAAFAEGETRMEGLAELKVKVERPASGDRRWSHLKRRRGQR